MTLSEELTWRGFVNQTTLPVMAELDGKTWTFYHGFDASADSQTVGNLAAMMLDLVFLRHGHKAVVLAGGATSLVGDPSGKDAERQFQSAETVAHNIDCAKQQLQHIYRGYEFTLVNNLDWFKDMNFMWFLREVGKHFGMSTLVQRDYIRARIGEGGNGMSFTEFTCTLMQGYDWLELFDKHGCTLQLAGSDQWGNSLSGLELIRKMRGQEVHILTMPLIINKATGKKFGKSEEGAVWLDEKRTSVYAFYQFWLNVDDTAVIEYLRIYTALDKPAIDELEQATHENPGARAAQKALAFEVTKLVHSAERAESVKAVTEVLFGGRSVRELNPQALDELAREIPVSQPAHLSQVLRNAKLASSGSEFRRDLTAGAISVDGEKQTDDVMVEAVSLVKKGKNNFVLVR